MRGPEEAAAYMRKLRQILRYLGICEGTCRKGTCAADVNVSVMPKGSDYLGTRAKSRT